MDFIACGASAYAIKGGIQIESCEIFTSSDFAFADLPPSNKAQLRLADDTKPIYQTTMFGRIVDTNNNILPNDDLNRQAPQYKLYKGYTIEAQEILPNIASPVLQAAGRAAVLVEQISLLKKYISMSDITLDTILMFEQKVNTLWTELITLNTSFTGSLTTGGIRNDNITVSGIPYASGTTYNYLDRWGFGTLSVKLVAS